MPELPINPNAFIEGTKTNDTLIAEDRKTLDKEMARQRLISQTKQIITAAAELTGNSNLTNTQDINLQGKPRQVTVAGRTGLSRSYGQPEYSRVTVTDPANGHIINDLSISRGHDEKDLTIQYCDYTYTDGSRMPSWRKASNGSTMFTLEEASREIRELPDVVAAVTVARDQAQAAQIAQTIAVA